MKLPHSQIGLPLGMLLGSLVFTPLSVQADQGASACGPVALKPQPLPPVDTWLQLLGALASPGWDALDPTPPAAE